MAEPRKQTEIGELPNSWDVAVCEGLCDLITVGIVVTPAKYYVPTGVPCFRSFNIRPNRLATDDLVFISDDSNDFHSKSKLRSGDVLVVRTGYPGTACVVSPEYDGANCIDLLIARPNSTLIDSQFLAAYLNSPEGKAQVSQQQGGLAQQHYNVGALRRLKVPLPNLEEQAAISGLVTRLQLRAERESAICNNLAVLKSAAVARLFREGLRGEPLKQLDFGMAPESWNLTTLSDVAVVQTGVAKGRQFDDTDVVEVPYLRVANVQDGHLDLSEMKTIEIRRAELERYTLRDGDVVLTEGGDFDKLGRGFIWRSELPLCIHQNHVFAVRTDRTVLQPEFFAYLAQSPYGKAYFLQVAHKTTNLACINSNKLKAFPIALPSLEEQGQVVEILDTIDQKLQLHKKKRVALEDLFQSLLQQLMTGEIRVNDLNHGEISHA